MQGDWGFEWVEEGLRVVWGLRKGDEGSEGEGDDQEDGYEV